MRVGGGGGGGRGGAEAEVRAKGGGRGEKRLRQVRGTVSHLDIMSMLYNAPSVVGCIRANMQGTH